MDTAPNGPSLLLVESEEELRRLIEESLEDAGFSVVSAATAQEAAARLDGSRNFAAAITDVDNLRSQDMSGWELARRARALDPDIPVVYMSGAAGAEWAGEGVPKSTFLQKPFALAQLIIAISTNLNKST